MTETKAFSFAEHPTSSLLYLRQQLQTKTPWVAFFSGERVVAEMIGKLPRLVLPHTVFPAVEIRVALAEELKTRDTADVQPKAPMQELLASYFVIAPSFEALQQATDEFIGSYSRQFAYLMATGKSLKVEAESKEHKDKIKATKAQVKRDNAAYAKVKAQKAKEDAMSDV